MKRVAGMVFIAVILSMLLVPNFASAADCINYPVGTPECPQDSTSVSDSSPTAGQSMTFAGCCFQEGSTVNGFLLSDPLFIGSDIADSGGNFSITFTIPKNIKSGTHTLKANGTGLDGNPNIVTTTIFIQGGLIGTGTNTLPWVLVGVGVVLLGGLMIGLSRRKSPATPDSTPAAAEPVDAHQH